jgi:hypothetical protein
VVVSKSKGTVQVKNNIAICVHEIVALGMLQIDEALVCLFMIIEIRELSYLAACGTSLLEGF